MSDINWAIELHRELEDAVHCLDNALRTATSDEEAVAQWPALGETADRIGKVLDQARSLLEFHPEIEAVREEQWEYICSHDSADGT